MIIERMNVTEIPSNNVVPTVLIGCMGTSESQVRTWNPNIVVKADRKIACPVVIAALTVAVRLMRESHGSTESGSSPSLFNCQDSSSFSSMISCLFSSILFVRWSA